jgi:hypothetical protein
MEIYFFNFLFATSTSSFGKFKMAESESLNAQPSVEKTEIVKVKRARKLNFKAEEEQALFCAYSKVKTQMDDPRTSNAIKNMLWQDIANAVSEVGICMRTQKQCRGNLHRDAKIADVKYRKSLTKTGGGPPTMAPSGVLADVAGLYAKQPGFSGIEGAMESNIIGMYHNQI